MEAALPPLPAPKLKSTLFVESKSTASVVDTSTPRVADENGVVRLRAGQLLGSTIFASILSSYQNLVYHPIALTMLVFALLILYQPLTEERDLFVLAYSSLQNRSQSLDNPLFKSIPSLIALLLKYIEKYRVQVAYIFLVLVPYIVKPSNRNLWTAVILAFIFWLKHMSVVEIILYSQFFYLYTMVRSPAQRLLIVLIITLFLLAPYFSYDPSPPPAPEPEVTTAKIFTIPDVNIEGAPKWFSPEELGLLSYRTTPRDPEIN